jgi:hypothetical protein
MGGIQHLAPTPNDGMTLCNYGEKFSECQLSTVIRVRLI